MKTVYLILILFLCSSTFAQESDVKTKLFNYDTCAPPCWLGLIPGVSTSANVEQVLEKYSDLISPNTVTKSVSRFANGAFAIDPVTDTVVIGTYTFNILTPPTELDLWVTSRIDINSGVVDVISVLGTIEEDISILDVIDSLTVPDYVHITYFEKSNDFQLTFIYIDERIRINFYKHNEECRISIMNEIFWLFNAIYYSKESASKPYSLFYRHDLLHPTLTRFGFETERDVPLDVWESWLSGEVQESCYEAWEKLPPPDLEAIAITPTPDVEITAEPTP